MALWLGIDAFASIKRNAGEPSPAMGMVVSPEILG